MNANREFLSIQSGPTTAFDILRLLGARVILSTIRRPASPSARPAAKPAALRGLFLQGLLIQLTNPKALLFVSALLPQFIDPRRLAAPQLLILVSATIAVDSVVLSSYAFVARRGLDSFRASRMSAWLERAVGAALLYFGFRLMFSRK